MAAPFSTYVAFPDAGTAAEWEVCVLLKRAPGDEMRRDLQFVVNQFWRLTNRGAFLVSGAHPSRVSLDASNRDTGEADSICWDVRTVNVDERFIQVLRNVLVGFSFTTWPVTELRVNSHRNDVLRPLQALPPLADDWALNAGRYPPAYAPVGFPIASRLRDPAAPRRYEIEYAEVLTQEQSEEILRALVAWGEVGLGGFAETETELTSGSCALLNVSPQKFDETTIELTVDCFGGGTPARNALLNLLCYTHQTVARIRRLSEEQ